MTNAMTTTQAQQEREIKRLQDEIAAVQTETTAALDELVHTQARTSILEAEVTAMRDEVIQTQATIILKKMEFSS